MRIAFSGAASTGKTTTLRAFLERWPQYKQPELSYRSLIKNNKHSKQTDKKIQREIRDFMVTQQQEFTQHDKIVFDRCPLDNIVYSLWAFDKNKKGFTDKYIDESIASVRKGMRSLDIIFLVTRDGMGPIEQDDHREVDETYVTETDNLFRALTKQYSTTGVSPFFPPNDSPALIEISGTTQERIEQISMYVTEDGNMYGEEQSLVNMDEIAKMERLLTHQKEMLKKEKGIL